MSEAVAVIYTPEELKFLRASPLVVKPAGLPPAEQWMGPPADLNHQTNRRSTVERHISRNSANPEDIILGPPKTSFLSATSIRSPHKQYDSLERPSAREADSRERFSFRAKATDGDNERTRESRSNTLRAKRQDGDQDSDGWSTVKPRKSFGTEGAERFNGRMGLDRHREDKRFKDREEREVKEKMRPFDGFSRDKDGDHEQDRETRRNGTGRGRHEPSWFKDSKDNGDGPPPTPRDRHSNGDRYVDRSRGWREKEHEDRGDKGDRSGRGDKGDRGDRGGDRGDRRWDRDREHRVERDPEWMDEPAEEKNQARTLEDFQKWKDQMQGKDRAVSGKTPADEATPQADTSGRSSFFGLEKQKVETPLTIDTGPDKFFGMWAHPAEDKASHAGVDANKEGATASRPSGKASRFTSFFSPHEEPPRRQLELPPPVPQVPAGVFGSFPQKPSQSASEKEAFDQLLQKLKLQKEVTGPAVPMNVPSHLKQLGADAQLVSQISPAENSHQYRPEYQEEGRPTTRNPQNLRELANQRQIASSQPTLRPEQMLHDLVVQRSNALSQSSQRQDQAQTRNKNTEFLMGLMQSAKAAPEPQRTEQLLMRQQPMQIIKPVDRQLQQQMMDRDAEMQREVAQREAAAQRERSASQRQARPPPPPGFFDDPAFQRGPPPPHENRSSNQPQPTQILQRPPPPGLDQMQPGWAQTPIQLSHPQQQPSRQHIAPPPGLAGGPGRGMPVQQQPMFPLGFPGNFHPPEILAGPPRSMQLQPPPGFFNAPPPGFMPPGMGSFPGPDGITFGAPYDARGPHPPPPQGAFRRQ